MRSTLRILLALLITILPTYIATQDISPAECTTYIVEEFEYTLPSFWVQKERTDVPAGKECWHYANNNPLEGTIFVVYETNEIYA